VKRRKYHFNIVTEEQKDTLFSLFGYYEWDVEVYYTQMIMPLPPLKPMDQSRRGAGKNCLVNAGDRLPCSST
jgi:hypothetical protein